MIKGQTVTLVDLPHRTTTTPTRPMAKVELRSSIQRSVAELHEYSVVDWFTPIFDRRRRPTVGRILALTMRSFSGEAFQRSHFPISYKKIQIHRCHEVDGGWVLKLKWAKFSLLFRWLSCSENGKIFFLQSVQKEGKKRPGNICIHSNPPVWQFVEHRIKSAAMAWLALFVPGRGNFSGCNDLILPKACCLPFSA